MPTITDKTEFFDQDASLSPAPPRGRRKRVGSGLREQLPEELIDELLAGAQTEQELVGPGGLLGQLTKRRSGPLGGEDRVLGSRSGCTCAGFSGIAPRWKLRKSRRSEVPGRAGVADPRAARQAAPAVAPTAVEPPR
jgi:hypothetical protein